MFIYTHTNSLTDVNSACFWQMVFTTCGQEPKVFVGQVFSMGHICVEDGVILFLVIH